MTSSALDLSSVRADARTRVVDAAGDGLPVLGRAESVPAARSALGESALWDARRGRVLWVDIASGRMLSWDGSRDRTVLSGRAGLSLVRAASGAAAHVIAEDRGVFVLDGDGAELRGYGRPAGMAPRQRFNDGSCDGRGRLWVGTVADAGGDGVTGPDGAVYLLDASGGAVSFRPLLTGLPCPNGIGWSPDARAAYVIESVRRRLYRIPLDERGLPAAAAVLVQFAPGGALPDGLCVLEDGTLLVAMWGAGCVLHLDAAGRPLGRVDVPTGLVTSVACAPGLLYVTTASGEGEEDPSAGLLHTARAPLARAAAVAPFLPHA